MNNDKIIALLNYLKEEKAEMETMNAISIISDTVVSVDGWEYIVVDESERYEVFKNEQKALWNDLGIESFTTHFAEMVIHKFLDNEKLYYLESYEFVAYDEDTEESHPIGELYGYDNTILYLFHEAGLKETTEIINRYDLLDFDALCHELIEWDGYAPTLARYDGEELELNNGYYAYLVG